jgi:hypothetical protein
MIGALIHTLIAAALAGLAWVSLTWWAQGALLSGVLVSIAPALFYGREMRDSQRERQSEGDGHRNSLVLLDLLPGTRPFRIGTLLDWVGPVVVWIAFFVVVAVT